MPQDWSVDDARATYSVAHWSDGYVDVGSDGRAVMCPRGSEGPCIALADAAARAKELGLRLPLLLRFPDILLDRRAKLRGAFAGAMRAHDYAGGYTALYPVKVNQQRADRPPVQRGEGLAQAAQHRRFARPFRRHRAIGRGFDFADIDHQYRMVRGHRAAGFGQDMRRVELPLHACRSQWRDDRFGVLVEVVVDRALAA